MAKKKTMAQGEVQSPDPEARYHRTPIPPEYAVVFVSWTSDYFETEEIDIPTEEGGMTIDNTISARVLCNNRDIALKSRSWHQSPQNHHRLYRVAQVTMTTTMEAMTMAAMAQPTVLDVAPPDMSNQQGGIGGKRKLPGCTGQTGRT